MKQFQGNVTSGATSHRVIILAAGRSTRMNGVNESVPKSLMKLADKSIIEHSLDALNAFGFDHVTLVVGYMRELIMETIGSQYENLSIDYIAAEDFATTEHGWSLFLTKDAWQRDRKPVILMYADNLYDPKMLDILLSSQWKNIILVDNSLETLNHEEDLVIGHTDLVLEITQGNFRNLPNCVGGFLGINRFSPMFMKSFYQFMDEFFEINHHRHKFERVLDSFIQSTDTHLNYINTNGLDWVNINYPEDYTRAKNIKRLS